VQAAPGPALICQPLAPFARHLFTTRRWTLGARSVEEPEDAWAEVARAIGVEPSMLVRARQVHGTAVVIAGPNRARSREIPVGDVVVTRAPGVAVAVQAADCVPLLIADPRTGAMAAAHAGWRGLAANVPRATVEALAREFGSRAEDLIAVAGPSIGPCCYEVGADVRRFFEVAGFSNAAIERWFQTSPQPTARNPTMPGVPAARRLDRWFFDGWTAVGEELEAAGVPAEQMHLSKLCTASHPAVLCSYRRDGQRAGRIVGVISAASSSV
jgi:YfiH family protein